MYFNDINITFENSSNLKRNCEHGQAKYPCKATIKPSFKVGGKIKDLLSG